MKQIQGCVGFAEGVRVIEAGSHSRNRAISFQDTTYEYLACGRPKSQIIAVLSPHPPVIGPHAPADRAVVITGHRDADLLPVEIPPPAPRTAPPAVVKVQVSPTPLGLIHPATQIGADPEETQRLFAALPPLNVVNQIGPVKGTGLTLLFGASPEGNKTVLAYQHNLLGTVLALTAQDSWIWQMHQDITPDLDQVYTSFWRQTLHWLADPVPD